MELAVTVSRKSKDPRCRVGAVVVKNNVVLSTGFNGLPRHVFDDPDVLADTEEKLRVICHAEQNAILNAARLGVALDGATMFVSKFPCLACCIALIQAGVKEIYTHDTKYWNDDPADRDHSRKKSMLRQAEIKVNAPFHPDYAPKPVTGKRSTIDSSIALVPLVAPKKKRKSARKSKAQGPLETKERPQQGTLFPARNAIRGGKSEK